jgi:hypothetical protein
MKSRKKVSRKKAAYKTRIRRSRGHSNRRTKRGGMMRSARAVAGTLLYHDILPLLSRASVNINFGRDPKADEYSITKQNERFYKTILDFPVDDGINDSIEKLREELTNPVKTADKIKSIKEKYDAIIKKLDEEERKQMNKQSPQDMMVVGKQFTSSHRPILSATGLSPSSTPNSNYPGISRTISTVVNQPFSTPRRPDYSTNKPEPDTLPSKGEIRADDDRKQPEYGTPIRNPFKEGVPTNSPYFSPPPPDQTANQENQNPQMLLSPGPSPVGRLLFDDTND